MKKFLNRIGNYLNAISGRLAKWKGTMAKRLTFRGLSINTKMFRLKIHDPKDRPRWIGPIDEFIYSHYNK